MRDKILIEIADLTPRQARNIIADNRVNPWAERLPDDVWAQITAISKGDFDERQTT